MDISPKSDEIKKKKSMNNEGNIEDVESANIHSDNVHTDESDGSEEEEGKSLPMHETLKSKSNASKAKKLVYVPEEETAAQRSSRTVFVGNIPVQVAKSKVCLFCWPLKSVLLMTITATS